MVRLTFFSRGKYVCNRRVRDFLGAGLVHVALEAGDWDLHWGSEYGVVRADSSGEAEWRRGRMGRGRLVCVWGEVFEASDMRDVWLSGCDARGLREAAEAVRGDAFDPDASIRRLTGGTSASAMAEVLRGGGVLRCGSPACFTCDELFNTVKRFNAGVSEDARPLRASD